MQPLDLPRGYGESLVFELHVIAIGACRASEMESCKKKKKNNNEDKNTVVVILLEFFMGNFRLNENTSYVLEERVYRRLRSEGSV